MSKTVRISTDVYEQLSALAKGFENPSQTIARVLKEYKELKEASK